MKDTLRDRRTLWTMILIPFLLLPVILSVAGLFTSSNSNKAMEKQVRVAIYSNDNGEELIKRWKRRKDMTVFEDIHPGEFKDLVKSDSLDFAIIIPPDFDEAIDKGATGQIDLYFKSSMDTILYQRVAKTIQAYHSDVLESRLQALGASAETIRPTAIRSVNVYTQKESLGKLAGGLLPYFFVLFCFMGAMYPAIDLFTGEKERSTIETLLVVPAKRIHILIGKMLVVVSSGVMSGLLTILGLFVALKLNTGIPSFISGIVLQILSPASIVFVILMMIPLTTFFAGILIPASIYSKSFKEAQSLIQPMIFVAVVPLVIGMSPGIELNFLTALVPILNVALCTKELIAGTLDYSLMVPVFLSLFALAGIGIWLSRKWFGHEGNILRI